jgi:hypothetical protein
MQQLRQPARRTSRVSPLTIAVVRGHHERWDGTGYPAGKRGTEIHLFARIAAVANVYDAVTADRPYRHATAPHIGVDIVKEGSGTHFDPLVVDHFNRLVMPYPVGYPVEAPDGFPAVVVSVEPAVPERPTSATGRSAGNFTSQSCTFTPGRSSTATGMTAHSTPPRRASCRRRAHGRTSPQPPSERLRFRQARTRSVTA